MIFLFAFAPVYLPAILRAVPEMDSFVRSMLNAAAGREDLCTAVGIIILLLIIGAAERGKDAGGNKPVRLKSGRKPASIIKTFISGVAALVPGMPAANREL